MTTRSLAAAALAAALCSVSLAAPSLAQEDASKTSVTISKRPGTDGNGNITLQGYLKSPDPDCRKNRSLTLYRTVNSGFGDSTKKIGKATLTGTKNRWTYKVRRSGTYVAKSPATPGCGEGVSKKLKYTRFVGN